MLKRLFCMVTNEKHLELKCNFFVRYRNIGKQSPKSYAEMLVVTNASVTFVTRLTAFQQLFVLKTIIFKFIKIILQCGRVQVTSANEAEPNGIDKSKRGFQALHKLHKISSRS